MAYKVIILYRLYMPSYVLGTFTEYPYGRFLWRDFHYLQYKLSNKIRLLFTGQYMEASPSDGFHEISDSGLLRKLLKYVFGTGSSNIFHPIL
jgi:hypothetical protein